MSYDPKWVRDDAVVKRDGTNDLTGDWDIGNQRKIVLDELQIRDASGLTISDTTANILVSVDNQTGLFSLKNGVGVNEFSTDSSLTQNSDNVIPTQSAVKTYVANNAGLQNIVEDLSPELGGDLNVNGSDIVSDSTNRDIILTPYGTGEVKITEGEVTSTVTLSIEGNVPEIKIVKTNEPVDEKIWAISAGAGYLGFGSKNDAEWSSTQFMRAYRGTGSSIDYVNFYDPIQGHAGLVSNPGFTFYTDTNTGMYRGGEDILRFATGGTERLEIELNGTLNVGGTSNYENLVTDDDDIPNKKYVDDNAGITEVLDDTTPQLGGTLDVNDNIITNAVSGGNTRIYAGDGGVLGGSLYLHSGDGSSIDVNIELRSRFIMVKGTTGGYSGFRPALQLYDGDDTHYVGLEAPATVTSSRLWTLPQDDPTVVAGHFLTTNSSGELSFVEGLAVTDSTTIIFAGDIYCNDIFTSGSTIHVGTGEIKSTAGNVELYHDGDIKATTQVNGLSIVSDPYSQINFFYNDSTNLGLAISSYTDDNAYFDLWAVEGASFIFRGEGYGVVAKFVDGAACELYHDAELTFSTYDAGLDQGLTVYDGVNEGHLSVDGSSMYLWSDTHGHTVNIGSENTGGSYITGINIDPDNGVDLYFQGAKVSETTANGITGAVWG